MLLGMEDVATAAIISSVVAGIFSVIVIVVGARFKSENSSQHAENKAVAQAVLDEVKATRSDVGRVEERVGGVETRVTGLEGVMTQHLLQHVEGRMREEQS